MVFGSIEISDGVVDGKRWVRDLRTGEAMQVPVELLGRLAERWFWRLF
jgi:hypothetical protein